MKKAFKGLFKGKKSKKDESPSTATETAGPADAKPTETTPAAPAPATAPEHAETESTPATAPVAGDAPVEAPAPAAPAAAPAHDEAKKDQVAALTEVRKATASRSLSHSNPISQEYEEEDAWEGSRRRMKVALDNQWTGPA